MALMDFAAISTLFFAVLALAMKPGPGMMAIISRTMAQGMSACLTFMVGVNLVNMFFLSLVLLGLRVAEEHLIFISLFIKAMAAVYLIWLGLKGLNNPEVDFRVEKDGKAEGLFDTFTGAAMLTLSNPLVILFYAGILPTILVVPLIEWADVIVIASIIIVVETGVAVAYCIPFVTARHFISPVRIKQINIVSSIILILIGLYIGYSALPANDLRTAFLL